MIYVKVSFCISFWLDKLIVWDEIGILHSGDVLIFKMHPIVDEQGFPQRDYGRQCRGKIFTFCEFEMVQEIFSPAVFPLNRRRVETCPFDLRNQTFMSIKQIQLARLNANVLFSARLCITIAFTTIIKIYQK